MIEKRVFGTLIRGSVEQLGGIISIGKIRYVDKSIEIAGYRGVI